MAISRHFVQQKRPILITWLIQSNGALQQEREYLEAAVNDLF